MPLKRGDLVWCAQEYNEGFSVVGRATFGHLGAWTTLRPVIGKCDISPKKQLEPARWTFHGPIRL